MTTETEAEKQARLRPLGFYAQGGRKHADLVRMYDAGFKLCDIAERSGYSEAWARQVLIRYGREFVPLTTRRVKRKRGEP